MWRMLQQRHPSDFVIATGQSYSLRDFVFTAFNEFGLDWREYVRVDAGLLRPADHLVARANPIRAERELGWKAKVSMPEVVKNMARSVP
jgi:GDPmannose 4,6-dehydratase